jgi:AP-5 complex subunit zeta-1
VAINDVEFMWKQMLLALMDEAYTGSTIGDGGADSESDDSNTMDAADPLFLELLKDENDGLAVSSFLMPQVPFCIF